MAGRRSRALVADSLLAIVLAIVSVALAEPGRPVESGQPARYTWNLSPPPRDIEPGDTWAAQVRVFRDGVPAASPAKVGPAVTVRSNATGRWTTVTARPTGRHGVYRARVVFADPGEYSYSVLLGDETRKVPVGEAPAQAPESPGAPAGLVVLLLLASLPVAVRRRAAIPVLAVTLAAALASYLAYDNFPFPGPLLALYTVGAHVGRPGSLAAAAGTAGALALLLAGDNAVGFIAAIYAVFAAAWLLGDNLRTRRERAARLAAEREANVQRTAAEEQARVARELHDIIGHSVSVMTIQAAAAGDAFDHRPAQVREALRAIESTGREALAELRRLLAGVATEFAPSPGLGNLEALVERVRSAGLDVELATTGRPGDLPPSVDLSAYRIVQEALTNTLKHAQATKARVDLRRTNGALEIEVVDDGRATVTDARGGRGIIGMRERAAMFGGDLSAGPEPGGGFVVRARIPVAEP
jgi:signal transduction histidine kinase